MTEGQRARLMADYFGYIESRRIDDLGANMLDYLEAQGIDVAPSYRADVAIDDERGVVYLAMPTRNE